MRWPTSAQCCWYCCANYHIYKVKNRNFENTAFWQNCRSGYSPSSGRIVLNPTQSRRGASRAVERGSFELVKGLISQLWRVIVAPQGFPGYGRRVCGSNCSFCHRCHEKRLAAGGRFYPVSFPPGFRYKHFSVLPRGSVSSSRHILPVAILSFSFKRAVKIDSFMITRGYQAKLFHINQQRIRVCLPELKSIN